MKHKYTLENTGDEVKVYDIEPRLQVTINDVMFAENSISRIEIFKHTGTDTTYIFTHIFSGNIRLGAWLTREVVIQEDIYSDGSKRGYTIRLPYKFE